MARTAPKRSRQLTNRCECRIAPAAPATHCPSASRRSIVRRRAAEPVLIALHIGVVIEPCAAQQLVAKLMDRCPPHSPSDCQHDRFPIGVGRGVTLRVGREQREVDGAIAAEQGDGSGRARDADLPAKPWVAQVLHDANPVAGVVLPRHGDAQTSERVRQLRPRHSGDRLQFLSRQRAAEPRGAVGDRLEPEPQDDRPLAHAACEGDEEGCGESGGREGLCPGSRSTRALYSCCRPFRDGGEYVHRNPQGRSHAEAVAQSDAARVESARRCVDPIHLFRERQRPSARSSRHRFESAERLVAV